jgi:hypothetical protein
VGSAAAGAGVGAASDFGASILRKTTPASSASSTKNTTSKTVFFI